MINIEALTHGREPKNGEYLTIVIDGRGASGKTALAAFLGRTLEGFTVLNGDDYFEPHDHDVTWGDFNEQRFQDEVLTPINLGFREFSIRPFDFPRSELGQPIHLSISSGVIIERCFSFTLPLSGDVLIWVETPPMICLERGLQRDGAIALGERASAAWEQVWQPREARYISESSPMKIADYVVDGTRPFGEEGWLLRSGTND
jgi:hypothetical protein